MQPWQWQWHVILTDYRVWTLRKQAEAYAKKAGCDDDGHRTQIKRWEEITNNAQREVSSMKAKKNAKEKTREKKKGGGK